MAIQLKGLDAEVIHLSSLLAVRTLQLEMEHVYGSLEAEALDVFNGLQPGGGVMGLAYPGVGGGTGVPWSGERARAVEYVMWETADWQYVGDEILEGRNTGQVN